MTQGAEHGLYVVEDDVALGDALRMLLLSRGLESQWFSGAEAFLQHLAKHPEWQRMPSCTVMDVRMPKVSGIEAFARLNHAFAGHAMSVIFLTGHGDIAMAVQALKDGAFDFMEKPLNDNRLVDRIEQALEASRQTLRSRSETLLVTQRLTRLSPREKEVMELIVKGKLNKVIAAELGISMRTVEVHRSSIFDKMDVRSAVELANLLAVKPGG